jgi:hypothetical protein
VLYFANPSTPKVREAMSAGLIGMIATPKQGNRIPVGATWCADNGVFGKGWVGDDKFLRWLKDYTQGERERCVFVVAPDVVADAAATLKRSAPWLPTIRDLGYPVAFVAQDGLEDIEDLVPWGEFDVLFIGGSTEWKLGPHARYFVSEAKARGKRVHMGRVNSNRRFQYAGHLGCDSVDGTYITFGPDVNLPKVRRWATTFETQGVLF